MFKLLKQKSGFTLLEVTLALTILSIGLGICLQLFSGSLQAVQKSEKYTDAVFLAQSKMEEWTLKDPLEEVAESGDFGSDYSDFSWHVEVSPYQYAEEPISGQVNNDSKVSINMMQIKVRVSWQEGEKEHGLELISLRTCLEKEAAFL
ncbi:MAG: type II secretion system protein [Candidatus Schekmanbacteria bacterium]|nr:type II secretion system protein [Candidatus Schekmanbacteria bacterium]